MKFLVTVIGLSLLGSVAQAQDQKTTDIPFTAPERGVMLEMCGAAVYANRMRFDGLCDALKRKFEEAAAAAEKKAETPATPEK